MSKETGGPAFPIPLSPGESYKGPCAHDGMTLRDYFAAKAMQAMNSNPYYDDYDLDDVARLAYGQADAMLAARAQ